MCCSRTRYLVTEIFYYNRHSKETLNRSVFDIEVDKIHFLFYFSEKHQKKISTN